MTTTTQRLGGPVAITVWALVMLALSLLQPAEVRGQWTTPDASQNINNTNTGNVGIGTTVPAYKLDLSNSVDKGQIRFGMGASDTGGYLYSGGPSHAALSGGASWNSGWIARSLSASLFEANNGQLMFYANSGTSTGSPFTPTERMRISSSGSVGIGTTLPNALLDLASTTQLLSRIRLSGQEYYQAGNTSTSGIDIRLGANRSGERQLWFADSASAINATNAQLRMRFTGSSATFDSISTDGTVTLPLAINATGGNVGIGTLTPSFKLDVAGQVRSSSGGFVYPDGILQATAATGSFKNIVNAAGATQFSAGSNNDSLLFEGTGGTTVSFNAGAKKITINSSASGSSGWTDGGANVSLTNSASNVGIGITSPAYKLDVNGGFFHATHNVQTYPVSSSGLAVGWNRTGGAAEVNLYNAYDNAATSFQFSQKTGASTAVDLLTIKGSGNVGIGTTNPTARLSVGSLAGTAASATVTSNAGNLGTSTGAELAIASFGFTTASNSSSLGVRAYRSANGSDWTTTAIGLGMDVDNTVRAGGALWLSHNGNIGIGTNSPGNKLSVNGSAVFGGSTGSSGEPIEVQGESSGVALKDRNGTSPRWVLYPSAGVFHLYNDSLGNALSVSAAGNVGIGTGPSSNRLEVSGNLNASGEITGGTIKAKYQDVAEWVESSQSLPAGTVVVLDHTKSNQVVASTAAYDTRVAGVISARPGITLGESGETKVLVATTGRVRIKVDATHAPIQVGDLLVTGDREGYAMKSQPVNIGGVELHRPGTLVGKALEPLAKGTGEILVLLSLQ